MHIVEKDIRSLIHKLEFILEYADKLEKHFDARVQAVHPAYRNSARNLLHYLAFRHFDLRTMQEPLAKLGLSSLGRSESHVQANLRAVKYHLHRLLGDEAPYDPKCITLHQSKSLLNKNIEALLGPKPGDRSTRIMVTFPSSAGEDYEMVHDMLCAGMDIARINCAKDDAATWLKMIENLRKAEVETGRSCRVLMDLAGPKLRTGKLKEKLAITKGDEVIIYKEQVEGKAASISKTGQVREAAFFSISLPEVFADVKVGEAILIDDGKIRGEITEVHDDRMKVKINFTESSARIKSDKGVNFPDTQLSVSGLTEKDKEDLKFIVRNAGVVNMSFIRKPEDVAELLSEIEKLDGKELGVMLKIETQQGFRNLPMIILEGMRSYPIGIMIARGDLAIETGWERTAELQEEMLWITEAAHIPNVWATQVLEKFAKHGLPSRAEITDAAMSQRSDCVMLNKGPNIVKTIEMLSNILSRMQAHQYKKSAMLRSLSISDIYDIEKVENIMGKMKS